MDAIVEPLRRLVRSLQWFTAAPEVRLLHVVTSGQLRIAALEHIAAQEHDPSNTTPYVILETPYEADEDGWSERALELRADMETLRGLLAEARRPVALPPMPDAPAPSRGIAGFAVDLRAALDTLRAPLAGLVIVLAPVWVKNARGWQRDLAALLDRAELADVRFIVVDLEAPLAKPISDALGPRAEQVDARVDGEKMADESRARLENMKSAPAGSTGPTISGLPGPRVAPPPRPRAPKPPSREQLERAAAEAGLPVAVLEPDKMQALRIRIMDAAQAASERRFADAVPLQLEARDLCRAYGLFEQAVTMEIMLGSYMLQAERPDLAIRTFDEALAEAKRRDLGQLAVQAQMAKGSAYFVMKRPREGIRAYAEAGELGMQLGAIVLAIEGYRVAGQFLAERGDREHATQAFLRALEAADALPREEQKATSAAEAARALAALCRTRRLDAQADALEAQAARLEGTDDPEASAPDAPRTTTASGVS